MKVILGRKLKMDQIWNNDKVVPVTLIEAGPCQVTQIKTKEKDGYDAIQVGFQKISKKIKITKTNSKKPFKVLREIPESQGLNIGDNIDLSIFSEGEKVDVQGISKGKGYQGPVRRWGFAGGNRSHGTKHTYRQQGSIGCRWPQRVIKGKHMAGRMGNETTTVKKLSIAKIDKDNNLLFIKGAVPGRKGTILKIVAK